MRPWLTPGRAWSVRSLGVLPLVMCGHGAVRPGALLTPPRAPSSAVASAPSDAPAARVASAAPDAFCCGGPANAASDGRDRRRRRAGDVQPEPAGRRGGHRSSRRRPLPPRVRLSRAPARPSAHDPRHGVRFWPRSRSRSRRRRASWCSSSAAPSGSTTRSSSTFPSAAGRASAPSRCGTCSCTSPGCRRTSSRTTSRTAARRRSATSARRRCAPPPGATSMYSDLGLHLARGGRAPGHARASCRPSPTRRSSRPLGMRDTAFLPVRRAPAARGLDGARRRRVARRRGARSARVPARRRRRSRGPLLDGRRSGPLRARDPRRRRRGRQADPVAVDGGLDDRAVRRPGRHPRARLGRAEPVEGRGPLADGDRSLRVHGHRAVDRSGQGPLRPRLDQPGASRRQGGREAARGAHQHARRARRSVRRSVGSPAR